MGGEPVQIQSVRIELAARGGDQALRAHGLEFVELSVDGVEKLWREAVFVLAEVDDGDLVVPLECRCHFFFLSGLRRDGGAPTASTARTAARNRSRAAGSLIRLRCNRIAVGRSTTQVVMTSTAAESLRSHRARASRIMDSSSRRSTSCNCAAMS